MVMLMYTMTQYCSTYPANVLQKADNILFQLSYPLLQQNNPSHDHVILPGGKWCTTLISECFQAFNGKDEDYLTPSCDLVCSKVCRNSEKYKR